MRNFNRNSGKCSKKSASQPYYTGLKRLIYRWLTVNTEIFQHLFDKPKINVKLTA
jgi:hypothetical protein